MCHLLIFLYLDQAAPYSMVASLTLRPSCAGFFYPHPRSFLPTPKSRANLENKQKISVHQINFPKCQFLFHTIWSTRLATVITFSRWVGEGYFDRPLNLHVMVYHVEGYFDPHPVTSFSDNLAAWNFYTCLLNTETLKKKYFFIIFRHI